MLNLIETLGNTKVTLDDSEYPTPSITEDDAGKRSLILASTEVPVSVWLRAHERGVSELAVIQGGGMTTLSAEDFVEFRTERSGMFSFTLDRPVVSAPVSRFVNLHNHSDFSALDGLSDVPGMVARAVELGQSAVAVTDHGVCSGHPELQIEARKAGIKPIFGIEAYFVHDRRVQTPEVRNDYHHLMLWAQTTEGLRNLWAMSTEANRTGFWYRPRMDWEVLARHSEGVMASTACLRGPLADHLLNERWEDAVVTLARLQNIFADRLYVEIQTNRVPDQRVLNERLITLAEAAGVPIIAAADSHYLREEDGERHGVWLAVQTNRDLKDDTGLFGGDSDYHMPSEAEVREALSYLPDEVVDEAIENTSRLAERCEAVVEPIIEGLPTFSKADTWAEASELDARRLRELCEANWGRCVGKERPESEYRERFEREMGLLSRRGFCGYFVMVADYCSWAKRNGILVGPGRGSAGGSLVAYLADIISIDPVANDVMFERFLTEGRTELPDFDCVTGDTEFHRDGPGDRTVGALYRSLYGRPGALDGECEVCAVPMESIKRGYKGNPSTWICRDCYRKRWALRKRMPSILGRNVLGRLSNQPLVDVVYRGSRETVRITAGGRSIESTPEHRHLTSTGWVEAKDIAVGDLMAMMDDKGRRARMDSQLGTPVVFRPVVSVEDAGVQDVYDVVMGSDDHSWVANGFVTHNCDFPASKRGDINDYLVSRWGEDRVVRVGTHIRTQNKGIIRDMARVMKGVYDVEWGDVEAVSRIIDAAEADTAGLGLSWEDLWTVAGDELEPYVQRYPVLFDHAQHMVGRLKSYGKHPAGMVISTSVPLVDRLPLRRGDDDVMVAEFDLGSLEALGLVKFDILTLRTLDTIQECIDLIREQRGDSIDVYSWDDEYRDPQVWEEVSNGHTLGIFQIETAAGTRDTKRLRPQSLTELADVITVVRPGPKRSGLAEMYFRRRAGEEPVSYPDPRMEQVLARTYGVILYQEQVMQACMLLAGYSDTEADAVRKIMGKKQAEKVAEAGEEFRRRAVEYGTDPQVAETLWDQMAEFAFYAFGFAHAFGYAMLGAWSAWLKFHYPLQFLTAALSTVDKGDIPRLVHEARRMGYRVLPPDINLSGRGFSGKGTEVRYGFDRVKGVGASAVAALIENQPYASWEDFMERKGKVNMGVVKLLASAGAFDSLVPNRRALEARLAWESDGSSERCVFRDDDAEGAPNGLPCTFDWANEEAPLNDKGQRIKLKPIPKRCTKRCRNYTPPQPPDFDSMDDYSPKEVMDRELELFGLHLTHTPFDSIPDELWDEDYATETFGLPLRRGSEITDGPNGTYLTVATLSRKRPHTASNGKVMGFSGWMAVDAELDVVVFSSEWAKWNASMKGGGLFLVGVNKNDRGLSMFLLQEVDSE